LRARPEFRFLRSSRRRSNVTPPCALRDAPGGKTSPSAPRASTAAMGTKEICKYYLHGACRNGAGCRFSHSMDAPKSTVCAYYLAGNCAYGDKCRYDHVRPPKVRRRAFARFCALVPRCAPSGRISARRATTRGGSRDDDAAPREISTLIYSFRSSRNFRLGAGIRGGAAAAARAAASGRLARRRSRSGIHERERVVFQPQRERV
jgi:hypothetical protein